MVTPVLLSPETRTFYDTTFDYVPVKPWDATYPALTAFFPSYGNATIDNRFVNTGGNNFDVYFYTLQNYGFLRYKSSVTASAPGMSQFKAQYNETSGKIMCGFYSVAGFNITAQIFESVNSYSKISGDHSEVAMTQVFSGTFDVHYFAEDSYQGLYNLVMFPAGGLSWGISVAVNARAPRPPAQAYWAYTVIYDPLSSSKYVAQSTWPVSTGIQVTDIISFNPGCAMVFNGGNSYTVFEDVSQSPKFSTFTLSGGTPDTTIGTNDQVNGLTLTDYNNLAYGSFWRDQFGYWYGGTKTKAYRFASDFTSYTILTYIGGDDVSSQFFANLPISSDVIAGYSFQYNAELITNSDPLNPLILTSNPVRFIGMRGTGPIIPTIGLPCQNFCIPMFRMKKYV